MSTVSVYKPHPDPWQLFHEDDPLGDIMLPFAPADVDPKGSCRVSGFRGTNCFVEISQQSYELPGHEGDTSVTPVQNARDDLTLGEDGAFSVILGP